MVKKYKKNERGKKWGLGSPQMGTRGGTPVSGPCGKAQDADLSPLPLFSAPLPVQPPGRRETRRPPPREPGGGRGLRERAICALEEPSPTPGLLPTAQKRARSAQMASSSLSAARFLPAPLAILRACGVSSHIGIPARSWPPLPPLPPAPPLPARGVRRWGGPSSNSS